MSETDKPPSEVLFDRVALVGIGHIGSSLARAIKSKTGLVGHLAISDLDEASRNRATQLGLADSVHAEPADAVVGADCVVLCTPIGTYRAISQAMAPHLKPGCIVSDVGSVKRAPIRDMQPNLPETVHFVPGHPVAGTENSGPESGFAALFEGRYWLLTPSKGTDPEAVARLRKLYEAIGAIVEEMDADYHDKVLAVTSHVPHLIAYTIVGTAVDLEEHLQNDVIRFSAGGFRDFTRIAGSNPIMWRDIFLNNREAVLEILQRFTEDLTALQRAIRWGEGQTLQDLFTRTRAIRRGVIDARQEIPPSADDRG
ncbi:prephenate/arogenate dehydrogenase family protein [Alphaproteobacteria bacterium]|nr:prephenate/arogenate dehydrogenase family protein [Alphaproteobacteria bacterium]